MSLAVLTVIFAICALRTNIVFVSALVTLVFAFCCGAGAFWSFAEGNIDKGKSLTVVRRSVLIEISLTVEDRQRELSPLHLPLWFGICLPSSCSSRSTFLLPYPSAISVRSLRGRRSGLRRAARIVVSMRERSYHVFDIEADNISLPVQNQAHFHHLIPIATHLYSDLSLGKDPGRQDYGHKLSREI
jgi:hypothetical protein